MPSLSAAACLANGDNDNLAPGAALHLLWECPAISNCAQGATCCQLSASSGLTDYLDRMTLLMNHCS